MLQSLINFLPAIYQFRLVGAWSLKYSSKRNFLLNSCNSVFSSFLFGLGVGANFRPRPKSLISSLESCLDDMLIILGCVVARVCCPLFSLTPGVRCTFVVVVTGGLVGCSGCKDSP